jgi:hypothetical protein
MAVRYGQHKVHYRITHEWTHQIGRDRCAAGGLPLDDWYMALQCDDAHVIECYGCGVPEEKGQDGVN